MTTLPLEDHLPTGLPDTAMDTGNVLREARIKAGLSEQDAAKQLRLDSDTIRYLEEENYQRLPAPAFVRGYLRNYAALLGVPPDPLVQAFNRRGLPPPPLKADITQSQAVITSRSPIRIAGYGVAFGVVILTAVHLEGQNPKADKINSASVDDTEQSLRESDATILAAAGVGAPDQLPLGTSVPDLATKYSEQRTTDIPKLLSQGDGASEQTETTATRLGPEIEVPRMVANAALIAPQSSTRESTSPAPGPGNQTATINAPIAEVSHPVVEQELAADSNLPVQGHLAMRFAHDSWVEIYDDRGTRLYYRLVKGGEALELVGAPPFRVLLGYAKNVDIEYNGRPFDHRSFIHPQGLARFTLGERTDIPASNDDGTDAIRATSSKDHSTVRPSAATVP